MATVKAISKVTIQIENGINQMLVKADEKIDVMLECCPLQKLFTIDKTPPHPYYIWKQSVHDLKDAFHECVSNLSLISIKGRLLQQELIDHKVVDWRFDNKNLVLENLAKQLVETFRMSALLSSRADQGMVVQTLNSQYGMTKGNIETPFLKITKECNAVKRNIQKLVKLLLDVECQQSTLRNELEKLQMMHALIETRHDEAIVILLR